MDLLVFPIIIFLFFLFLSFCVVDKSLLAFGARENGLSYDMNEWLSLAKWVFIWAVMTLWQTSRRTDRENSVKLQALHFWFIGYLGLGNTNMKLQETLTGYKYNPRHQIIVKYKNKII